MSLFQNIVYVVFSMLFLILLSFLIGYVALPVFLIIIAAGLFKFFKHKKMFAYVNRGYGTSRSQQSREDERIIDVDYTELP